ncbi:MAG: CHRD domain-containing protein [Gammaproteobacteria bacterium]|mgnify:FL=1|nr:CHRD domain-containing protein [Gammaproteobacteria bacterium]
MKLGHTAFSRPTASLICALVLTFSAGAVAQSETFRARLSPMPTTPQTVTTITGEGEVILTLDGNTLTVSGNFTGMNSVATMAHVHNGPPAQPGPVVHQLEVTKMPAGEISAVLELTDAQVTALRNNELYIQVHSETNPPGELRGWIFARN